MNEYNQKVDKGAKMEYTLATVVKKQKQLKD